MSVAEHELEIKPF